MGRYIFFVEFSTKKSPNITKSLEDKTQFLCKKEKSSGLKFLMYGLIY